MKTKILILIIFIISTGFMWSPLKKGDILVPIIYSKECGDNVLIGLDTNRNKIIDTCYELKWVDGILYKRYTLIYYLIYDNKELTEQGCVCNED